ncbi:MAG: hypothetical protein QM698_16010 [Micropepsaceae bacterium]
MSEPRTTPDDETPQAPNPAIRALVFGLGAAIVVMTVLLVVGLLLGWHKKEPALSRDGGNPVASVPKVETAPAPAGPAGPVTPLDVTVPRDAAIYTITGDGPLVALHVRSPGGDEVIVVNTAENRVISRIRLKPEGAP